MASFVFRFERVLKVKESREKQFQRALATALRRVEAAQALVDSLRQRIHEREVQARNLVQASSVETWRLELVAGYMDALRRRLHEAESDLSASLLEVDERRAELVEAVKERKILEALKEREHRSFLAEEARQEQRLMDEVAERTRERQRRSVGRV